MTDRYTGKPLVRLLECYALDAIGELSREDRANLEAMEPRLSQIYGTSGSWKEILGAAMQFPPEIGTAIKGMWEQNRQVAAQSGQKLSPQHFAEIFVDQNFASN